MGRAASGFGRLLLLLCLVWLVWVVGLPPRAAATVPYPACIGPSCPDPTDYAAYLFLPPGVLPDDYAFDPAEPERGSGWKYAPGVGMDVTGAWQITTGRPDVVVAVLDSGIRWREEDLARKLALNLGELPHPCPAVGSADCDGDGVVTVLDFDGFACPGGIVTDDDVLGSGNGNGHLDGQDLLAVCSDGVDDDGNGYVDDIAGWDVWQDDNDPFDDVDYGHGTGQGEDSVGEADNGGGFPGVAPSATFVPVRVADSFIVTDSDFARGLAYADARGVDLVSEALGAIGFSRSSQQAIDWLYDQGIPVVASAADEESRHHNAPAIADHVIWVNSIRNGDDTLVPAEREFTLLNGCTNYGGKAWVAISSTACSSEATGRAAGLVALLVSHGKNLLDQNLLEPYPGSHRPFSAEEIRQLLRASAQDIDRSNDPPLPPSFLVELALSGPLSPETVFRSTRFPTQAGWDQYTGYGRPDARRLLELASASIPPEADLTGSLRWFDTLDPTRLEEPVAIVGSAAAVRAPGDFEYRVEVGCGVEPTAYHQIAHETAEGPLRRAELARWDPAASAALCGFDPAATLAEPDDHTVTVRLRVRDRNGLEGVDRRTVAVHSDPTLKRSPLFLGASGEASPVLADLDRDGVQEIIVATTAGEVHVLDGASLDALPGFPARTPVTVPMARRGLVPAWASGEVRLPRDGFVVAPAVGDLDRDGRLEIVAASLEGRVYVFDAHGQLRRTLSSDPAFSAPERRDPFNDVDPGFATAPVLVDLDAPDGPDDLEIVVAALDGHVYAFRQDGSPVAGFPVRLGDRERLEEDSATGRWKPKPDGRARRRLAKTLSSPAVGDLDGDGRPEIVIGTNEEYRDGTGLFSLSDSGLLVALQILLPSVGIDDLSLDVGGRLYALNHDGSLLPGWPVQVPLLAPGLLPTVATGTPGGPALARVNGELAAAIFGAIGPVMLFRADGSPFLGLGDDGAPRSLAVDFPGGGFPLVPDPATLNQSAAFSFDAPFFGSLGSGAFGDLDGDGEPEYVAPTGGLRILLDVALPARQAFANHSIAAWRPADGALLPQFPRVMDDMQFFTSPGLADVDGDGRAEVVQGSGAYLVRAFRHDGIEPPGWPKFTHGWIVATPAAGDVDGDDQVEVVVISREGNLYVWETPAPATAAALPWAASGRDRRNTRNLDSGVSPLADPPPTHEELAWDLEALFIDWLARLSEVSPALAATIAQDSEGGAQLLACLIAAQRDDAEALGDALAGAEEGLRTPDEVRVPLADLHERLLEVVREAAERAAAEATCGPTAGSTCALQTYWAPLLVQIGDGYRRTGRPGAAIYLWSQALQIGLARAP